MKASNFILYYSQWPALKSLSVQELGELLQAIFRYLGDEDEEDIANSLSEKVEVAFRFLLVQIKYDSEKYEQKKVKNRERQQRFYDKNKERNLTQPNASNAYNNNNSNTNSNNNRNTNSNNNKNISSKAAIDINNSNGEAVNEAAAADFSSFLERMRKGFLPWFNKTLDEHDSKIPRVKIITEERARRIKAIIDSYGQTAFEQTIRIAAGAAFLNGRGEKNKFVATLDWIIDPSHFLDVYEGKYCV